MPSPTRKCEEVSIVSDVSFDQGPSVLCCLPSTFGQISDLLEAGVWSLTPSGLGLGLIWDCPGPSLRGGSPCSPVSIILCSPSSEQRPQQYRRPCSFLFFYSWLHCVTCEILVPQPGIESRSPCGGSAESQPLNSGEFPRRPCSCLPGCWSPFCKHCGWSRHILPCPRCSSVVQRQRGGCPLPTPADLSLLASLLLSPFLKFCLLSDGKAARKSTNMLESTNPPSTWLYAQALSEDTELCAGCSCWSQNSCEKHPGSQPLSFQITLLFPC